MRIKPALAALAVAGVAYLVKRGTVTSTHAAEHPRYWADWEARELDDPFLWVALGDSTSQAVGVDDPGAGWIGEQARRLEAELGRPVRVVNLAISGGRVKDLVERQLPRFEELKAAGGIDLVTCVIGSNDVIKPPYDPEQFRRDFRTTLDALPAGSVVSEVPYFGPRFIGVGVFDGRAKRLTEIIREELAGRDDLVSVPLRDATRTQYPWDIWGNLAPDFFHPNAKGYAVWGAALGRGIDEALSRRHPSAG